MSSKYGTTSTSTEDIQHLLASPVPPIARNDDDDDDSDRQPVVLSPAHAGDGDDDGDNDAADSTTTPLLSSRKAAAAAAASSSEPRDQDGAEASSEQKQQHQEQEWTTSTHVRNIGLLFDGMLFAMSLTSWTLCCLVPFALGDGPTSYFFTYWFVVFIGLSNVVTARAFLGSEKLGMRWGLFVVSDPATMEKDTIYWKYLPCLAACLVVAPLLPLAYYLLLMFKYPDLSEGEHKVPWEEGPVFGNSSNSSNDKTTQAEKKKVSSTPTAFGSGSPGGANASSVSLTKQLVTDQDQQQQQQQQQPQQTTTTTTAASAFFYEHSVRRHYEATRTIDDGARTREAMFSVLFAHHMGMFLAGGALVRLIFIEGSSHQPVLVSALTLIIVQYTVALFRHARSFTTYMFVTKCFHYSHDHILSMFMIMALLASFTSQPPLASPSPPAIPPIVPPNLSTTTTSAAATSPVLSSSSSSSGNSNIATAPLARPIFSDDDLVFIFGSDKIRSTALVYVFLLWNCVAAAVGFVAIIWFVVEQDRRRNFTAAMSTATKIGFWAALVIFAPLIATVAPLFLHFSYIGAMFLPSVEPKVDYWPNALCVYEFLYSGDTSASTATTTTTTTDWTATFQTLLRLVLRTAARDQKIWELFETEVLDREALTNRFKEDDDDDADRREQHRDAKESAFAILDEVEASDDPAGTTIPQDLPKDIRAVFAATHRSVTTHQLQSQHHHRQEQQQHEQADDSFDARLHHLIRIALVTRIYSRMGHRARGVVNTASHQKVQLAAAAATCVAAIHLEREHEQQHESPKTQQSTIERCNKRVTALGLSPSLSQLLRASRLELFIELLGRFRHATFCDESTPAVICLVIFCVTSFYSTIFPYLYAYLYWDAFVRGPAPLVIMFGLLCVALLGSLATIPSFVRYLRVCAVVTSPVGFSLSASETMRRDALPFAVDVLHSIGARAALPVLAEVTDAAVPAEALEAHVAPFLAEAHLGLAGMEPEEFAAATAKIASAAASAAPLAAGGHRGVAIDVGGLQ